VVALGGHQHPGRGHGVAQGCRQGGRLGAAQGRGAGFNTDFGGPGWGGPCPPVGHKPHRYNFSLHALKVDKLDLPQGSDGVAA
jgi:phosphatidylethanolamine-binding protein (PEBP) family uncharacterized protein